MIFAGFAHRYVYGIGFKKGLSAFEQLVKLNVESKEFVIWEESVGFPSEPVFLKAPGGKTEDDGVILSCVINTSKSNHHSLGFDAREFKELGRAVIQGVTTATFHGIFQQ